MAGAIFGCHINIAIKTCVMSQVEPSGGDVSFRSKNPFCCMYGLPFLVTLIEFETQLRFAPYETGKALDRFRMTHLEMKLLFLESLIKPPDCVFRF